MGEELAVNFLQSKGYEIICRNWRTGHKEIDIIARLNNLMVFVEVKSRSSIQYGYPESFISENKIAHITQAAMIFLEGKNWRDIRFDVIAISYQKNSPPDILHITDAFY